MNTSTNDPDDTLEKAEIGGAFADGLTFVRLLLTPVIMFTIILAWSGSHDDPLGYVSLNMQLIILSSVLFGVAALTDLADDLIGGSSHSKYRIFGWFDDIADSVLIDGTLIALLWVVHQAGLLTLTFLVPAIIYIARDIIVAILKGYELTQRGFYETRLGDIKNAIAMLATSLLVAAPWLSNMVDSIRVKSGQNAMDVYNNSSTLPWNLGVILLAIAAVLALITGYKILTNDPKKSKGE